MHTRREADVAHPRVAGGEHGRRAVDAGDRGAGQSDREPHGHVRGPAAEVEDLERSTGRQLAEAGREAVDDPLVGGCEVRSRVGRGLVGVDHELGLGDALVEIHGTGLAARRP